MATLRIKNSSTASAAPPSLLGGEIAINRADRRLFYLDAAGSMQSFPLDFLAPGAGAARRGFASKISEWVSVVDYGAVGNGVTDDALAFNEALAAHKSVYVPPGTYALGSSVQIKQVGQRLWGHGTLLGTTAGTPIITSIDNIVDIVIDGLKLTRNVAATGAGHGVSFVGLTLDRVRLRNLTVSNCAAGIALGITAWSFVEGCVCENNYWHGFYITNTAARPEIQWQISNCLAQMNDGNGFCWQATAGPAGVICGPMVSCATFANKGTGVAFVGVSSCPMHDARLFNSFCGADGASIVSFDTYGGQHQIGNCFFELAGQIACGRNMSAAATAVGSGIVVSSNNLEIMISGTHCNSNSHEGMALAAIRNIVSGCRVSDNGKARVAGRRSGVMLNSGRLIMSGSFSGNSPALDSQERGVYAHNGAYLSVTGNDFIGNNIAPFGAVAYESYIMATGNLPNTATVMLSAGGPVTIGGNVLPMAAGSLNTASGLYKAGSPYINP